MKQSHEHMIETIIAKHFKEHPKFIKRMVIGICNEVYEVGLNDKEVIVRLSPYNKFLMGSHDHIPKFKALGIKVPDILAEDYSKDTIPLSYQIQNKIQGQDLGEVIETLSDTQLKVLAKEVAHIFKRVETVPSSDQFGVIWGGGEDDVSDSWTERMLIWIEESKQRGMQTGVMDSDIEALADLMDELDLSPEQRELVTMYALLNQISWACENGIQFNQNTKAQVDQKKKQRDIEVIKMLARELKF